MKRRRVEPEGTLEIIPQDGILYWMKLPVEMLTEIISYLSSPDILALVRTNLFFFNLLVKNEYFRYIWKDARQRFRPTPIPAPSLNYTEVSLIAFLFDPSPCSVRNQSRYHVAYLSDNLQQAMRENDAKPSFFILIASQSMPSGTRFASIHQMWGILTKFQHCQRLWKMEKTKFITNDIPPTELAGVRAVQTWLPYFEDPIPAGFCYVKETLDAEIAKYKESLRDPSSYAKLQQMYALKAARLPGFMKYSSVLRVWGMNLHAWNRSSHRGNQGLLLKLCKFRTWDEHIFRDTPLYTDLLSWKKSTREMLTFQEIKKYEPEFKAQVEGLSTKRINASVSETIRLNQIGLQRYWNTLKSKVSDTPLLSYPEFRKLNMAKVLERTNTDKSGTLEFARRMSRSKQHVEAVSKELKNNKATCSHLQRDMQAVLDMKRTQLAQKLGYSREECTAMSSNYVHPAERITSWFYCKRCTRPAKPMRFQDIAEHQCRGLTRKQQRETWNLDWFEPHQQAIRAGKEILRNLRRSALTFRDTDFYAEGAFFRCKSCTARIILRLDDLLLSHCQRHDSLELENISLAEAQEYKCLDSAMYDNIVSNIHKPTKYGKKLRQTRIYGCRHCETKDHLPLFTFDGFRSHLKAKHDITANSSFEDIKFAPLAIIKTLLQPGASTASGSATVPVTQAKHVQ